MKVRKSILDNETIVFEIEAGDAGPAVDYLKIQPNGYAIMGENVECPIAVIDGRSLAEDWFTQDHLLAVEAHELGHIRMNSDDESVAELEGIRLLEASGHTRAAALLYDRGLV